MYSQTFLFESLGQGWSHFCKLIFYFNTWSCRGHSGHDCHFLHACLGVYFRMFWAYNWNYNHSTVLQGLNSLIGSSLQQCHTAHYNHWAITLWWQSYHTKVFHSQWKTPRPVLIRVSQPRTSETVCSGGLMQSQHALTSVYNAAIQRSLDVLLLFWRRTVKLRNAVVRTEGSLSSLLCGHKNEKWGVFYSKIFDLHSSPPSGSMPAGGLPQTVKKKKGSEPNSCAADKSTAWVRRG